MEQQSRQDLSAFRLRSTQLGVEVNLQERDRSEQDISRLRWRQTRSHLLATILRFCVVSWLTCLCCRNCNRKALIQVPLTRADSEISRLWKYLTNNKWTSLHRLFPPLVRHRFYNKRYPNGKVIRCKIIRPSTWDQRQYQKKTLDQQLNEAVTKGPFSVR